MPLRAAITAKVNELAQTVGLKRAGKANEALAVVLTDRGKETMDAIRNQLRDETGSRGEALFEYRRSKVERERLAMDDPDRRTADFDCGAGRHGRSLHIRARSARPAPRSRR